MRTKWKVLVTASWSARLPDELARIGISRGPPRGQRGYRMYRPLMPGAWFRTVPPDEFYERYMTQVAKLDPERERVVSELNALASGRTPALLCFEPDRGQRGVVACALGQVGGNIDRLGGQASAALNAAPPVEGAP